MQLLLIKVNGDASPVQAPLEVARVSHKEEVGHFEAADWEKARELSSGHKVVVFIPNEDVLLTEATVPSKNKKQLLQAIPYALEERLADDIEALHFAIFKADNDEDENITQVAIINHQRMEYWLDILQQHGLHPHYVLPSLFTIPMKTDGWVLVNQYGTSYLRQGQWSGFSCDMSLLTVFLEEELEKNTPEMVLYSGDMDEYPEALKSIEYHLLEGAQTVYHDDIVKVLELNLLTDFSRGDSKLFNINWKPWLPVISLAGLFGVIWLGMLAWQNHHLDKKLTALDTAIARTYTAAFPGSTVVNAPVQMKQKLAALQKSNGSSGGSSLALIAVVSPFLKKFPNIDLKEVRHQNNELLFVVSAPSLSTLERFKSTLTREGKLTVKIKSSTTTANKVESTLVVKGAV